MIERQPDNKPEIVVGSLVKVSPEWIPQSVGPILNAQDTYKVIVMDENQKGPKTCWICPVDMPESDIRTFVDMGQQKRLNPALRDVAKPKNIWGFSEAMLEFQYKH